MSYLGFLLEKRHANTHKRVNLSDEALNFFCDDKNFQNDEPL